MANGRFPVETIFPIHDELVFEAGERARIALREGSRGAWNGSPTSVSPSPSTS